MKTAVVPFIVCFAFLSSSAISEDAPNTDVAFPSFDYEVSCYEGFQSIAFNVCKQHEENARDFIKPIWDKFFAEGAGVLHCICPPNGARIV